MPETLREVKPYRGTLRERIVYEDEHLLCIDKPQGITSVAERDLPTSGLLELARREFDDIYICHRLDRHTTGTLLFAKTEAAHRHVSAQFEQRQVRKTYQTLLHGVHQWQGLIIEAPIGAAGKGLMRIDYMAGKESITVCNTLRTFKRHALVACHPFTGRTHQIRVHLMHIGHPVLGDVAYGGHGLFMSELKRNYKPTRARELGAERDDAPELPLNSAYVLHAAELILTHPATATELTLTAPPSNTLATCLKVLEKYD